MESIGDPVIVREAVPVIVRSWTLASVVMTGLFGVPEGMTAEVNRSGNPPDQLAAVNQAVLAAPVHVVVFPDFT